MRAHGYRRYVVTLLLLVYVFNQLDRSVFTILMDPIKRHFSLDDTQLGFLAGPAIVVLYSILGVPVARWADRRPRVAIMSIGIALWSVVTVSTAGANEFWQLALARVGVGIGAAGFSAIAVSVIGDYESDQQRARAVSNFMLAIPIANLLSDFIGGWVNQLYGWRWVFVLAGLPGLLLAVLMRTTVKEPLRRQTSTSQERSQPSMRAVFLTLWQRRSLRHLVIAQALSCMVTNAIGWASVFFIRQHHMSTGELGSWLGIAEGLGPFAGIWLSGVLAARLGARDPAVNARLTACASILVVPLTLFFLWCPSKEWALLGYLLVNIPMFYFLGPTQALVQELVGANMRATMSSVFILLQLLAGGVVGVQVVGLLSDVFTPMAGSSTSGLRWSMALVALVTIFAAVQFWLAGRFVRRDLAVARGTSVAPGSFEPATLPSNPVS